ncbi:hypothetical protein CVT26_005626 [Gymnopilus dilepis]|uniref:JmjC domain-containing protein n=1 Tax=Gymnopilus dilepis TaxID=231916 RepID=A0A409XZW8_9AGAR|nr:hypothetical protein CVT26_005626 [Gymnopilus dilepis]
MISADNETTGKPKRMLSSIIANLRLRTTVLDGGDGRELDKVTGSWPEYKTLIIRFLAYEECVLGIAAGNTKHAQMRELLHLDLQVERGSESTPRLIPKERLRTNWNASQYGHLCSMLCLYWLVDVLGDLADVGHRLPSVRVGHQSQTFEGLLYYGELSDWPAFMMRFKDVLHKDASIAPCPWSQADSACWRLLQYLDSNAHQSAKCHIVSNLTVAAMHLAFLKEYSSPVGVLPDLPDQIHEDLIEDAAPDTKMFLVELARVAGFFITSRSRTAKGGQSLASFRAPLQLALAISPLYLFCQTVLCKKMWNRRLMLQVAFNVGGAKPFALIHTENSIWTILLAMANGTLDPSEAMSRLDAELPWSLIQSVTSDHDRLWFNAESHTYTGATGDDSHVGEQASQVVLSGLPVGVDLSGKESQELHDLLSRSSKSEHHINQHVDDPSFGNGTPSKNEVKQNYAAEPDHLEKASQINSDVDLARTNMQHTLEVQKLDEPCLDPDCLIDERMSAWTKSNISSAASSTESDGEEIAISSSSMREDSNDQDLISSDDDVDDGEEDYRASQTANELGQPSSLRRSSRIQALGGEQSIDRNDITLGERDRDQRPLFLPRSSGTASPGPRSLGLASATTTRVREMPEEVIANITSSFNDTDATEALNNDISETGPMDLVEDDVHRTFQRMRVHSEHSFKVFGSTGRSFELKPESHHQMTLARLKLVLNAVERSYYSGRPVHIVDAERSVVAVRDYEEFAQLTDCDLHALLAKKNLVVRGTPLSGFSADERSLSTLYPLHNPVLVRDHSVPPLNEEEKNGADHSNPLNGCTFPLDVETAPHTCLASLMDVIRESRETKGKILEAPHIPLCLQDPSFPLHLSNVQAWFHTQGRQRPPSSDVFPSTDFRWASIATQHAASFFRFSPHGMHAYTSVLSGRYMWIFGNSRASENDATTDVERSQCLPPGVNMGLEAVVLEPGEFLIIGADQLFATYACQTSVLRGEYFYSNSLMQESARAIYRGFASGGNPLEQVIMDANLSCLPSLHSFSGVRELLNLLNIHILANVLDPRTYATSWSRSVASGAELHATNSRTLIWRPISFYERLAMVHARGLALELLDWVRHSCYIVSSKGEDLKDFPTEYLLSHLQTLLAYKAKYEPFGIRGFPNCDYAAVHRQIMNLLTCDSQLQSQWSVPENVDAFDSLHELSFFVTWTKGPAKPMSYVELLNRGATVLDLEYFSSHGVLLGKKPRTPEGIHKAYNEDPRRPSKRPRVEHS